MNSPRRLRPDFVLLDHCLIGLLIECHSVPRWKSPSRDPLPFGQLVLGLALGQVDDCARWDQPTAYRPTTAADLIPHDQTPLSAIAPVTITTISKAHPTKTITTVLSSARRTPASSRSLMPASFVAAPAFAL